MEILSRREHRMHKALMTIDEEILETLNRIHKKSIGICLISNADKIDCKYWKESPLYNYFDASIFSCDVGLLKPEVKIYQHAMREMNVLSKDSLFVGDGGSNEFYGAKQAGMKTIFTEHLDKMVVDFTS